MPRLPDPLRVPHPARFGPERPGWSAAMGAHERALDAGDPGYLDPATGLFVITAQALWDRGRCCESGCRHCPFVGRGAAGVGGPGGPGGPWGGSDHP